VKILNAALILSTVVVGVPERARAGGVMYSAPLRVFTGETYCDIRNAGTMPIEGTIETVDYGGFTVSGPVAFTLAPGVGTTMPSLDNRTSSCKVTLTKGSPKKVRGVAVYNYLEAGALVIPIQ
jgi:hypothetical protein